MASYGIETLFRRFPETYLSARGYFHKELKIALEILEIFPGFIYSCAMSGKIFISYGKEDYSTAKRLYDDLEVQGLDAA